MIVGIDDSGGGLVTVTWNPADTGVNITLSGSDLVATRTGNSGYRSLRATTGHSATDAGGFYFEVVVTAGGTSPFMMIGVANLSQVLTDYIGVSTNGWAYYQDTGQKTTGGSSSSYGASYTTGDVIGVLLKNGKLYFRKNGTWQNSADVAAETGFAFSGLTGTLYPAASLYRHSAPAHVLTGRFKAADFSGGVPSGASAWGA